MEALILALVVSYGLFGFIIRYLIHSEDWEFVGSEY
jgi:hypothetical protein